MPTISPDRKDSMAILVFQVEPAKQGELVDAGKNNSQKVLEKKPGFISASIYKSFDGNSVVNYSEWENRKSYDAAINFLSPEEVKIGEKIFEIADPDWNIYELVFSSGQIPAQISTSNPVVTVINVFSVEPKNQQRLIEHLKELSKNFVELQPGFVSANVHRSFDGNRVISYAQWKTKEDYKSIYANPDAMPYLDKIKTISKFNWNIYQVSYTSG